MNADIRTLQRRIADVKKQLLALGELRPGNLSQQYNVCGNPTCRCKADPPQKHGPYSQLSWTRKRKSKTRFVSRSQVETVRAQLTNYDALQQLIDQWVELSIELCDLRLKEAKERQKAHDR